MNKKELTADIREQDRQAVHGFFKRHPEVFAKKFCLVLDNAFKSTKQFPLTSGFSLLAFVKHYATYEHGPLGTTNGNSSASTSEPELIKLRTPSGGLVDVQAGTEASWLREGYTRVR
jgi:hypothetical protein